MELSPRDRVLGGLWGAVIGDALGVPVEFKEREHLRSHPVKEITGYGTYNQPPGTWSDDTSLMVCTVESLLDGLDLTHLGSLFVRWLHEAYWTPWGEVFDIGNTTHVALRNLARGIEPEEAGPRDPNSNGNGSLMRILPVAIRYAGSGTDQLLDTAHRVSKLTHGHPRSQIACGIYCLLASLILQGFELERAYRQTVEEAKAYYHQSPLSGELTHYVRILSGDVFKLPESEILSSGYVVHTLEASIWCLLTTTGYDEAVLKAVNLGGDTDTTGIVTGGLAGLYYGVGSIPEGWRSKMARREDLQTLFDRFEDQLTA